MLLHHLSKETDQRRTSRHCIRQTPSGEYSRRTREQVFDVVMQVGITSDRLKLAQLLLSGGRNEEALTIYEKIISTDPLCIDAITGRGGCLWNLGKKNEAVQCYMTVLTNDPDHVIALYGLALAHYDCRQFIQMITLLERAHHCLYKLPADSDYRNKITLLYVQAITDYGTQLKMEGNREAAISHYTKAIQLYPNHAPTFYNSGVLCSDMGRLDEALTYYNRAIMIDPYCAEAHCNIGFVEKSRGNNLAAIEHYARAIRVRPNYDIALHNMAVAMSDLGTEMKNRGDVKGGISKYKEAIHYDVRYSPAYYNLGVAYTQLGKSNKAKHMYELAISFNPTYAEAHNNLGVLYERKGNVEKALQCYRVAVSSNPQFIQPLNNIGVIFTAQGKVDEAIVNLMAVIEAKPEYSETYNNLGVLYRDLGDIPQSISNYDKCLQVNPSAPNAAQNRLLSMNYSDTLTVEEVQRAHFHWGSTVCPKLPPRPNRRVVDGRAIRVGYISPDFFTHSVSYFIESLLSNHNNKECTAVCYSNAHIEDARTIELRKMVKEWRNVNGISAQEVCKMIVDDDIDVLVELAGHTAGNRMDVINLRPCAIQMTYLGYPNTTGHPCMDYRMTDEVCDPHHTTQKFSEKLLRIPGTPHLHNGYVTFGSFNNLAKITDSVISLWSKVLIAVPHSRLVVKCKPFVSQSVRARFLARFAVHGIDPFRIDMMGLTSLTEDHLRSYRLMDVSLDTFPYAGTTTTCEALYMGVPVLTLTGKTHAQNVSASILKAVGCDRFICDTDISFVEAAKSICEDLVDLQRVRASLRAQMQSSPLCDAPNFTRKVEEMYRKICTEEAEEDERITLQRDTKGSTTGAL
ncbi:putative UDP-N-acetylglucosamine--peptide N-acetylglucosaminyltransferase SPINDLY-like [Planoprotostelium fungivorum]|uniref:protein O-GlcNAc transferase n=1 Tax=Planoprotostelium fungivorum TaxID=1890364 RepID=A0A2P6NCK7_9EUKA|nr:putative UDP-N-acetylglucosamine--peptide N-acetylglucosaminyltransferase SPINDLY-like [Planoprotostelium fungivorum]